MRKISSFCSYLIFTLCLLSSCNNLSNKVKDRERKEIMQEVISYRDKLPYSIPGTGITLTEIDVDGDIIIYTCRIANETWEAMSLTSEIANTDRNIARIITNLSNDAIDKFIEYEFGLKYIYISEETDETLFEIDIPFGKLKEIKEKVEKGDIIAYTMIELTQMEIAKMDIPSQLDEGVWLTDAYIKGSTIYYICTIENEINPSDLTSADLSEMKESCIEGLKEEGLVMMHIQAITKENIHFVYIYKDSRGIEFARVNIGPDDL